MRRTKLETWRQIVAEQTAWIAERGNTLAGYLAYYPTRTPENVADIYDADTAALAQYCLRLAALEQGEYERRRWAGVGA